MLLSLSLVFLTHAVVEESSDWLVLCTADGKLFTVHAWTGSVQADQVVHTDPLIGRSIMPTTSSEKSIKMEDLDDNASEESDSEAEDLTEGDSSSNIILPGLDGRLYWQQDDGSLQALQLEISSLLEQPVKSCHDDHEKDCGILTATVETSLLALNAQGMVQWYDKKEQHYQYASATLNDQADSSQPFLLLQRRDYHVKHVQSSTGKQAWNISMGSWQALDFGTSDQDDEELLLQELPGHAQEKKETLDATGNQWRKGISLDFPVLPAIVFSNHGQTLIAVDLVTLRVLWTMDTPSVVASVFGMQRGQWKPVQVLQEQDLARATSSREQPTTLAIDDHGANEKDEDTQKFLAYALQDWFTSSSPFGLIRQKRIAAESTTGPKGGTGTKPKFPRRSAEMNVCMPGDDCRNIPDTRQFLQLPHAPTRVQPEGLYLSWSLVVGFVIAVVAFAGFGGHFWYTRKKRKWLEDMQLHTEIIMSAVDRKLVPSETQPTEPLSSPHASREHSQASPTSFQEQKETDSTQHTAPVTMTAIGGIPLVRYSRYATEFEELEPLGKGGFGSVWRVRNLFDGRQYAMKKVQIHGSVGDPQFHQRLERTLREVKILAALDHPNIVRYYNAWLELEKDNGEETQTKDSSYVGESSADMSRCYSSSMLTDSVSQWPSLRRGGSRPAQAGLAPLRRNIGMPSESSLFRGAAWRPSARDDASDYLVFEVSYECGVIVAFLTCSH